MHWVLQDKIANIWSARGNIESIDSYDKILSDGFEYMKHDMWKKYNKEDIYALEFTPAQSYGSMKGYKELYAQIMDDLVVHRS